MIDTFFLYPLFLYLFSAIFARPVKRSYSYTPAISIIISAYNEESLIADAIESVFNSGYPADKLKVLVGSDGSSDGTLSILKNLKIKYPNLDYYDFPRLGKNQVLNRLVPQTNTEFIVYMDADCRCNKNSLNKIISNFSDPQVGAVISSMVSVETNNNNDNTGRQGETLYQKYETYLRSNESRISSTINSLGALYSIHRDNYRPLPNNYVCDDYMPLLNTAKKRKRVIFDKESVVYEVRQKSLSDEFMRRVRLAAGGMATVWQAKSLLLPVYGWVSLFLWSHKVLRWLSPLFLIGIAGGTLLLPYESKQFKFFAVSQIVIYISAIFGWLFEKIRMKFLPFRLALFFVSMNIGFLLGLFRFITGGQNSMWERNAK